MKRFLAIALLASALMVSCADDFKYKSEEKVFGTLSFADLQISVDQDEVVVRSEEPATETYYIYVYDSEGTLYNGQPYIYDDGAIVGSADGILLPEGVYSIDVRSQKDVAAAKFENAIYGTTKENITITAGQTTEIGKVVCTLIQCKVTVDYNDDFLAMVAGNCNVTVTVGESLNYALNYDATNKVVKSYEKKAGYFAINNGVNTSMEVKFAGVIVDKNGNASEATMTKAFENIAARQWRQIKFIKKIDAEGNATFDIVIDDYVEDNPLGEDVTGSEEAIGSDPNAPKGDGNIKLLSTAGLNENTSPTKDAWNAAFTDEPTDVETYEVIVLDDNLTSGTDAEGNPTQLLQFEASVPNKIKDFYIVIDSDMIGPLLPALIGDAEYIDLVHDTTAVKAIAEVVPFPYHDPDNGVIIAGATSVAFNLDKAVGILRAMGNAQHTFKMTVKDEAGYTKNIDLVLNVVAK